MAHLPANVTFDPDTGQILAGAGGRSQLVQPQLALRRGGMFVPRTFGFDFRAYFPYDIWQDAGGRFHSNFDPSVYIPHPDSFDGTVLWLDPVNGADVNAGTYDAPKKTFKTATTGAVAVANTAAADTLIVCKSGLYDITSGWNGGTRFAVPNLYVIGHGGPVTLSLHQNASWSSDGTYTNCFSTTSFTTFARAVYLGELDAWGNPKELVEVSTPTLCDTQDFDDGPGFICGDGSKIYIRLKDGEQPAADNIRVYRPSIEGAKNSSTAGALTVCAGLNFEGGNNGSFIGDANATGKAVLLNCSGKWAGRSSSPVDAFKARDIDSMIFHRCVAAYSSKDGFNFQAASGKTPTCVTLECWGHHNGISPSASNNGWTPHDGVKALDLNSVYDYNNGGNVTLTGEGCQAMMLGTYAGDSQGDVSFGGSDVGIDYYALNSAELWLNGCAGYGSPREFTAVSNAAIYHRNHRFGGGALVRTGKIETF